MNISLDNPTILGITNNYSFSQGGIALRQVQNISIEVNANIVLTKE